MISKRLLSLLMCLAMMVTMVVVPTTVSAAQADDAAVAVDNVKGYNLPADINEGNILHAFSWKLKEVTQYAQEIAEAGYTAVQVSPIQCTKDTTNDGAYANDWWCFYQPTDLAIGNELGNEADLIEMCNTLDKYGVKVIVDIVANHVQNSTDKKEASNVNPTLKSFLRNPSGIKLVPYNDGTRKGQTSADLNSQLPDLDTSNKDYQNYLINYLDTLADNGVDGFRFDAAKHIETPADNASIASDFWNVVLDGTTAYAKSTKGITPYYYGEVLNRIDDIIVFSRLKEDDIKEIAKRLLKGLERRMEALEIGITFDESVVDYISKAGYDKIYGARPLKRAIQTKIEDVLSEKILEKSIEKNNTYVCSMVDGELKIG